MRSRVLLGVGMCVVLPCLHGARHDSTASAWSASAEDRSYNAVSQSGYSRPNGPLLSASLMIHYGDSECPRTGAAVVRRRTSPSQSRTPASSVRSRRGDAMSPCISNKALWPKACTPAGT
jgi:hypothetical protein